MKNSFIKKLLSATLAIAAVATMGISAFAAEHSEEIHQTAAEPIISASDISQGNIDNQENNAQQIVKAAATHTYGSTWKKTGGTYSEYCGLGDALTHYGVEYSKKCTHTFCFNYTYKIVYTCAHGTVLLN